MTITKETVVDQITVTEVGVVLVREVTRIMENGELLSQKFHRTTLTPRQDTSGFPPKVRAICDAAWRDLTNHAMAAIAP